MAKNKIYIVGNAFKNSFIQMFTSRGWEVVNTPAAADVLQFTGGADINPALYESKVHPTTSFSDARDSMEVAVYNEWLGRKPMLGVCRGAQLFCALNGGTLYQDVDNHAGHNHEVFDSITRKRHKVSSVHHQMMKPSMDAEIIAVAKESSKRAYIDGYGEIQHHTPIHGGDPEVVYWRKNKLLGFQGHPEFGPQECEDYYFELINRYMGDSK